MAGISSASHNRSRIASVKESTWGVTPSNPVFTEKRVTSDDLNFSISTKESKEKRSDRMRADQIQTGASGAGTFGFEFSAGAFDAEIEGACMSAWVTTPGITNSAADTEITDVDDSTDTITVAAGGAAFKAGHLTRYTSTVNSVVAKVQSSTATSVVFAGSPALVSESAPAANAMLKVIGFEGASGDITATSTGLASTSLDFTTLGLTNGMWIGPGLSGGISNKFSTSACNAWARIGSFSAHNITFDIKPAGWAADTATGKSIRVLMTEYVRNGTLEPSYTYQRTFADAASPTYQNFTGSMINTLSMNAQQGNELTGQYAIMSKDGDLTTTNYSGATYKAAATNDIMSGVANVMNIIKDGVATTGYYTSLQFQLDNSLRMQNAVGSLTPVGIKPGQLKLTGSYEQYFVDGAEFASFKANTSYGLGWRFDDAKGNALFIDYPKVKVTDYKINAGSLDTDVLAQISWTALADATLNCAVQFSRTI